MEDDEAEAYRRMAASFRLVRRIRISLLLVSLLAIGLLAWLTSR